MQNKKSNELYRYSFLFDIPNLVICRLLLRQLFRRHRSFRRRR